MKTTDRIALLYLLGFAGAAGVSYARGRRGTVVVEDMIIHGLAAGTILNVGGYLISVPKSGEESALNNPGPIAFLNRSSDMGRMGKKAINLMKEVDSSTLTKKMKKNGVKIAPVPDNPSIVNQDDT